jgi:AAHS family benzoate transporter-like MFS transporter
VVSFESAPTNIVKKLNPTFKYQPDDVFVYPVEASNSTPLVALFKDGRTLTTLMFWVSFFMCLLMVYALGSWLPKLMNQAGYPLGSSIMFLMVLNIGAIFGAVGGGWLADKLNPRLVLTVFFALATVSISLLGIKSSAIVLNLLVAIAGATTIGTQIVLYSYVGQFYPLKIRSTGIGWASGVGRTGAILGPMLGGTLLSMQLPTPFYFYVFAIPGVIACVAIQFTNRARS